MKNHQDSRRIRNIRPFIDHYEYKEINFTTESKDCKKFETSNETAALNVLFQPSCRED